MTERIRETNEIDFIIRLLLVFEILVLIIRLRILYKSFLFTDGDYFLGAFRGGDLENLQIQLRYYFDLLESRLEFQSADLGFLYPRVKFDDDFLGRAVIVMFLLMQQFRQHGMHLE